MARRWFLPAIAAAAVMALVDRWRVLRRPGHRRQHVGRAGPVEARRRDAVPRSARSSTYFVGDGGRRAAVVRRDQRRSDRRAPSAWSAARRGACGRAAAARRRLPYDWPAGSEHRLGRRPASTTWSRSTCTPGVARGPDPCRDVRDPAAAARDAAAACTRSSPMSASGAGPCASPLDGGPARHGARCRHVRALTAAPARGRTRTGADHQPRQTARRCRRASST